MNPIPDTTFRRRSTSADTVGLVSPHARTKSNPLGAGRNPRAGEAATERVVVRLTASERAAYQAAAERDGLTLAEWIRASCEARLPRRKRG
ncbi:MAG: hypothetical protein AB7O24_33560 [Kofleriaceae bacterium]